MIKKSKLETLNEEFIKVKKLYQAGNLDLALNKSKALEHDFAYVPELQNLIGVPMIWNGGMSFHGALLGVVLATIIFCKKNNQNVFYYLDLVALSAPIGIFLGRIANFINSEL